MHVWGEGQQPVLGLWILTVSTDVKRLQRPERKRERRNDSVIREVFIFPPGHSSEPVLKLWDRVGVTAPREGSLPPVRWLSSCGV